MANGEQSRREGLIIQAVDPSTGRLSVEVVLSVGTLQYRVRVGGKGDVMEAAYTVPEVLKKPTQIFEGLCADNDEKGTRGVGWRCYCGKPSCRFNKDGSSRPAPSNRVFLVFVDDACIAYMWYWAEADENDPNLPVDYEGRFKRTLL